MTTSDKVLFIGHQASRSGAPLLMLELMKWLTANSRVKPFLLLKEGGELENDYRAIAPTRSYTDELSRLNTGIHRSLLRKLHLSGIRKPNLPNLFPAEEYPVVYANTVDTCDLAMQLAGGGRQFIHHIHELSYVTEYVGATKLLQRSVPNTHFYIADSDAVRDFLATTIRVPPAKIHVVHPFPVAVDETDRHSASTQTLRRQLGIPEDAFIVGMCGGVDWRKGTDLFVQLAMHVTKLGMSKCHFVWLGGDSRTHREALYDVARLRLEQVCHFVPTVVSPQEYFHLFDLFVLTSREDPFPVAMLEAAATGIPIVCFANAGGVPEFVENDAGVVVPYLDVTRMATVCIELLLDAARRRKLGENAKAKVQLRYTLEIQGPKILAILKAADEQRLRAA